eukprot:153595-Chlamydomonas_euryale.AAC.3
MVSEAVCARDWSSIRVKKKTPPELPRQPASTLSALCVVTAPGAFRLQGSKPYVNSRTAYLDTAAREALH